MNEWPQDDDRESALERYVQSIPHITAWTVERTFFRAGWEAAKGRPTYLDEHGKPGN